MHPQMGAMVQALQASMGPRSDNRGYALGIRIPRRRASRLQWVHGPITVVMLGVRSVRYTTPYVCSRERLFLLIQVLRSRSHTHRYYSLPYDTFGVARASWSPRLAVSLGCQRASGSSGLTQLYS